MNTKNVKNEKDLRVILAAGGSGGHIYPSVSLARELEKKGVSGLFFVSSKKKIDREILKNSRHKCFFLSSNPMPLKKDILKTAVFLYKLLLDIAASLYILLKVRPNVVVGFGGYSSGAIVASAKMIGIPVIIHEQNLLPGRANIILSRIADKIAISFGGTSKYFSKYKEKLVHCGNPLRLEMLTNNRNESAKKLGVESDKFTVLVMGGSQGSSFLNDTVSQAALSIKEELGENVQFIHLTGRTDLDRVKRFYTENGLRGRVFSFLERIDDAYAASDIAVSRSGAAAIFELAYYSKPMILVPYPHPKNNQRFNAMYFSDEGAAIYREETGLTSEDLAKEIIKLSSDTEYRTGIVASAGKLSIPNAGERLADVVVDLCRGK